MPQPHQGNPAQTAGLDHIAAAGAHRITVDAQGADPWPLPPLQRLVDTEDQGTVAPVQMLEQEPQQDLGQLKRRPDRPVEHLMIAGIVAVAAETHNPEGSGHRALAWGENGADQQHLGFPPSPLLEQRCERKKNG